MEELRRRVELTLRLNAPNFGKDDAAKGTKNLEGWRDKHQRVRKDVSKGVES